MDAPRSRCTRPIWSGSLASSCYSPPLATFCIQIVFFSGRKVSKEVQKARFKQFSAAAATPPRRTRIWLCSTTITTKPGSTRDHNLKILTAIFVGQCPHLKLFVRQCFILYSILGRLCGVMLGCRAFFVILYSKGKQPQALSLVQQWG